jgi:hypothetical protein
MAGIMPASFSPIFDSSATFLRSTSLVSFLSISAAKVVQIERNAK